MEAVQEQIHFDGDIMVPAEIRFDQHSKTNSMDNMQKMTYEVLKCVCCYELPEKPFDCE